MPRPSSPPGAKASTERSSLAREFPPPPARRTKPRQMRSPPPGSIRPYPDDNSTICLSQLHTHDERHPHRTSTRSPPGDTMEHRPSDPDSQLERTGPTPAQRARARKSLREAGATSPQHRNLEATQPEAPFADRAATQCVAGRSAPPPADFGYAEMEASGFEPLTPCLQSRCSTS